MPLTLRSTNLVIGQESVEKWAKDSHALVYAHWQELGLDLDLKIDPDIEKMRLLEQAGVWKVYTARVDEELVGYVLAIFSPHLHYKSSAPMLIVDAYYIKPEFRNGIGARLLKFTESEAKRMGAIKMYLSCKVHEDHSELFKLLGFKLSDFAFIKRL